MVRPKDCQSATTLGQRGQQNGDARESEGISEALDFFKAWNLGLKVFTYVLAGRKSYSKRKDF